MHLLRGEHHLRVHNSENVQTGTDASDASPIKIDTHAYILVRIIQIYYGGPYFSTSIILSEFRQVYCKYIIAVRFWYDKSTPFTSLKMGKRY